MKGKLRVRKQILYPYCWHWVIRWRGLYITSNVTDGYTTEQGARKAALNAANKLGIKVEETKWA